MHLCSFDPPAALGGDTVVICTFQMRQWRKVRQLPRIPKPGGPGFTPPGDCWAVLLVLT